jgi:hypothetical protein
MWFILEKLFLPAPQSNILVTARDKVTRLEKEEAQQ